MPYITPEQAPPNARCWRLSVPRNSQILAAILGQLLELTEDWNWEQTTGISVAETTALMQEMFNKFSVGSYCMIGSLIHYVTIDPPYGVLKCDGTQYLRVNYPDLYADLPASLIIDADNFIVPTIEDVFMLGAGTEHVPEDTGGAETHVLVDDELPTHSLTYDKPTSNVDLEGAGVPDPLAVGTPFIATQTSSIGNDDPHENMPPFISYFVGVVAL